MSIVTWLVVGGIAAIIFGGIFWYMIGWRNRMFRQPEEVAEPEPETALEQTMIEPSTGRLVDPEAEQMIGNPRLRWGRSVRRRYISAEYEGEICCLRCGREVLPGQFFWETPLISRETGEETGNSFQLCLSCQPGDVAAAVRHDA